MRKFIFTLLLAVVGGTGAVIMASERWCMPSYQTETEPSIVVSGVLVDDAFPCEPEEECPACLTIVLQADEGQTYYLTAGSAQADEQLDTAHLYANVTIEGVPFTRGSYNYIKVSNIDYILPVTQATKWYGVLYENYPYWPGFTEPRLSDSNYSLQGDTVISGKSYSKLCAGNGNYVGAIRYSASGRQAYYVPIYNEDYLYQLEELGIEKDIEKDAEYLLYDLNVKVGDTVRAFSSTINLSCETESLDEWLVLDVQTIDGRIHARVKAMFLGREVEWIEGIGTPYIVWSGERDCQPTDGSIVRPYTLCAADNAGNILYSYNLEHIGVINECPNWSRITPDNPPRLPSLCDTWNILEIYGLGGLPADEQDYTTKIDRLATDTVINNQRYVQLLEETSDADKTNIRYQGALREGDNAKIYFIPPASTHEYLLYAFNAQAGDKLSNLWIGGSEDNGGVNASVVSVTDEYPRVFTLNVEVVEPYPDGENIVTYPYKWVEGVGLDGGPRGLLCESVFGCACSCTQFVLCAYKDGKQVYAEKASEDWGCDFNHHPQPMHRLDDLCDEWTMVVYPVPVMPESDDSPIYYTQRLKADTIINGKAYRKLCGGAFWKGVDKNNYLGAMRQEYYYIKSQDPHKPGYRYGIFYIPEGSTHSYLLYDFNCYVGDTLRNLWVGGMNPDNAPDGYTGVVTAISASNPRRFELDIIDSNESVCNHLSWIEGVGTDGDGPTGESSCIAYDPSPALFCACKDGQKVYATTTNCQCGSLRLNYLCDTWNILGVATDGEGSHYRTFTQRLTTDTIINSKRYVKLEEGITYKGALREDDYGRVYIIPANSTHEYLSYASQLKVSDEFDNVWFGGNPSDFPNGSKVTVREIEQINGRKVFKLDVLYQLPIMEQARLWSYYSWIEGVGLPEGPSGDWCPFDCEGDYGQSILCAYKDGEQVYASETAEKFGCYYDSSEQHTDTVPLYVKDGPGSSTVDPVDPNEIVATLNGDELIIREYIGAEISFKLSKVSASDQAPTRRQAMQSDSFRESVTITLTESGTYELELTNPEWNYSIVGTFVYTPTGVEDTPVTTAPAQKVLMNGRLLIKHGDKVYTLTGMQVE